MTIEELIELKIEFEMLMHEFRFWVENFKSLKEEFECIQITFN